MCEHRASSSRSAWVVARACSLENAGPYDALAPSKNPFVEKGSHRQTQAPPATAIASGSIRQRFYLAPNESVVPQDRRHPVTQAQPVLVVQPRVGCGATRLEAEPPIFRAGASPRAARYSSLGRTRVASSWNPASSARMARIATDGLPERALSRPVACRLLSLRLRVSSPRSG